MTSLIHTIQQAFSGVTLGNGIGLSEGNAISPARFPYCRPQGQFRFDLVYTFIHLNEYKEQQFSLLNAQQKQAVAQYLHWICTDPNCHTTADDTTAIEEALLLFWET